MVISRTVEDEDAQNYKVREEGCRGVYNGLTRNTGYHAINQGFPCRSSAVLVVYEAAKE